MTDRKNTPFTNEHFMAYCEKMLGQPYWFGTTAANLTLPQAAMSQLTARILSRNRNGQNPISAICRIHPRFTVICAP